MNEKNNILPKHWQIKKLGEVCDVLDNLRKPINSDERQKRIIGKSKKELFPYYGATGQVGWIDSFITNGEFILIGEDGAPFLDIYKDKAYKIKGKTWVNNHAHILKGKEKIILDDFALYYLNSINYRKFVNGTTRLKLTKGNLVEIPFVIPPLPEQQAIVSKIEELLSDLENGKQQLLTAQQQLKVYRQSLLKWAFEGRLTNNNVKEGELPKGWKWVTLGDITNKKTTKALPKDYPEAKFIGMDCIEPHTLKPKFTYKFSEFKSAGNYFEIGQVLYGRMRPYLNKVYRAEYDGTCSGEFIILQCTENFNPDLLKYILHSKEFVSFANNKTNGDRPRISYGEIADYPIAIAPLKEQQLIVSELESKLTICDKIEETITNSLQQAETLRQSILKKAFEGRLV